MNRQIFLVGATLLVFAGCDSWRGERASRPDPYVTPSNTSSDQQYDQAVNQYNPNATGQTASVQSNLRAMDADFLREAAIGNKTEIELGRVAVKQAQSDKVRDFGQRMIDDHTKMLDETTQLARSKGLSVNEQLSPSGEGDVNRFSKLSGADFDREYMRTMISDHERDVDAYDRESRTGDDASVRSLASRALPTIREHLRMARDIEQNMTAPMIGQPHYDTPRPTNTGTPNPSNPSNPAPDNPTSTPENPR
jgi:putative membrane protein